MLAIGVRLADLDDEVLRRVAPFLMDVATDLVNFIIEEAPVGATGDLRRSWQVLRVRDGGTDIVVGSPVDHALYVHTGRRPYPGDPSRWPPIRPLVTWARRVLGADEPTAWAIRRHIGETGIAPNRYVDRAIERLRRSYR